MKRKKRDFTLLELLIAMTLTALILMTLSFFYRSTIMIGYDLDKIKVRQFYLRYAENRLVDVIPKILPKKGKSNEFLFYSLDSNDSDISKPGSRNLLFTFDNGVSLNKPFSNQVIGRLFLDPEGRLILAYWPIPSRWESNEPIPVKKEILLEKVDNLTFEFFVPPENKEDNKKTPKSTPSPEPKGAWTQENWLKDYDSLPAMVNIHVILEGDEKVRTFSYPLSNSEARIVYE